MTYNRIDFFAAAAAAALFVFVTPNLIADHGAFVRTADDPHLEWAPCGDWLPEGCMVTVLQGDPEKQNADLLFRIPANSKLASHWHTSAERMVLIAGEFHIDFDGQDPVVMKAGTYAYGPAKLPHSARCKDAGDCLLFIALEEPFDAVPIAKD